MNKSNIYIVEDMGITRTAISTVLLRNGHEVAGSSPTAEKAWMEISQTHPDLVIIDINLKGAKNGIWLAGKIREQLDIPIIFLTAYGSTSILEQLVDIQPDGYIMKPFNNATLLGTIQIAVSNFKLKVPHKSMPIKTDRTRVIKTRNGSEKINLQEILYLRSEGNYVHLFLKDREVVSRSKLDDLLLELDFSFLQKTHRRFAVNTAQITRIDKLVLFIGTEQIPISKTYEANILDNFK